jgi:hypothetical protein
MKKRGRERFNKYVATKIQNNLISRDSNEHGIRSEELIFKKNHAASLSLIRNLLPFLDQVNEILPIHSQSFHTRQ